MLNSLGCCSVISNTVLAANLEEIQCLQGQQGRMEESSDLSPAGYRHDAK